MDYLITLDIGTTAVKTSLYNRSFQVCAVCLDEYSLLTLGSNIIEMDPDSYWQAICHGIRSVFSISGADPQQVMVITIVTQGETLIPVDKKGNALRNAIVWLDSRAEAEAAEISNNFTADYIYSATGLPEISGACPAAKILWIKNHEPEIFASTAKFLMLEDYIISKLTGKFITDKSILSSTGYFDINREIYWAEMLDLIGVNPEQLPEISDCGVEAGCLLIDVADDINLNPSTIVSTGAMDQIASALGSGNIAEGIISETTGTALAIAATIDKPDYSNQDKLTIYKHAVPGKFLILPYCSTAGILLKWFKDQFLLYENVICTQQKSSIYAKMDDLAASSPPLSNGVFVFPHFAGMITPYSDDSAKGAFLGLGLDSDKADLIRAIMEAVAFMLRENIELIEKIGVQTHVVRSLGGGAKSDFWCQVKADILQKEIITMNFDESTSLGAALLGGFAIGLFDSFEEACTMVSAKKTFTPNKNNQELYNHGYNQYVQLYQHLKPIFTLTKSF